MASSVHGNPLICIVGYVSSRFFGGHGGSLINARSKKRQAPNAMDESYLTQRPRRNFSEFEAPERPEPKSVLDNGWRPWSVRMHVLVAVGFVALLFVASYGITAMLVEVLLRVSD